MNTNVYTRPQKPMTCKNFDFNIVAPVLQLDTFKPLQLAIDKSTECFITPDDVAARMVDYLELYTATIDTCAPSILEPSAGTGQLIQALLNSGILSGNINSIEMHYKLVEHLENRFNDNFVNINQGDFLQFDFINEYDRIIANPPFKPIIKHMDHIYQCLKVGGIAVCLVPISYKKLDHEVLEILPVDTFANCKVSTKIIRIKK